MAALKMFRKLSKADQAEFRRWARANYKPGSEIMSYWHPVTQDECAKINAENLVGEDEDELDEEDFGE